MARRIGTVFVQPDNPAFLEREIQPQTEVFDIGNSDPVQLLDAYREKQRNFTTAPFDPAGERLRFFPGGFTIWSGFPGAGKTTLLRQLACHLLKSSNDNPLAGQSVFVCSMEEIPQDVLIRHAEVAVGHEDLNPNELQWCMDIWDGRMRLWNYRPIEADAEYQKILAAVRVLAREGVRHVIIDSLMCLNVASDKFEEQRQFAGALARTCVSAGVHVHLVAHPRKPQQSNQRLDLSEVAGSADLGRKADNVLFVKRDFDTEGTSQRGHCKPMKIQVAKQRYGTAFIGEIDGWFNIQFRQFVTSEWQTSPMHYLPDMAHEDMNR